jgi:uncharacterized repeat protein (TIGR01451 family)
MRRLLRILTHVLVCLALAPAAWADAPGKNGARTIGAAGTVINQYDVLASAAAAGATSITVNAIANLSSGETTGGGALAAGDVVMLYQPRGASIDTTNTPTYGTISGYGNAGNYELRSVRSVAGNVITLDASSDGSSCISGLKNSYSAGAQVIRVPQYTNLTVNAGASVVASTWAGTTGGVLSALVQNTLTINGTVSVSGLGFRGGIRDGSDRASGGLQTVTFVSDANPAGGAKGEGIASDIGGSFGGVTLAYSNSGGNFEIGAPANGGGGGGSHNGGGGGGANAAAALTPYCTSGTATYTTAATTAFQWCGQGSMPATPAAAWALDPAYKANGNALTAHVGGGRGGYTYSGNNLDATTAAGAPGMTGWGGDNRRALGGWGGRPLLQALASRLFFGGGGGAGANNNNKGGAGGAGGGVILIEAGTLAGSGSITADGIAGTDATDGSNFGNDAPGGGGAGGTIVVRAGSGSVATLSARGGAGGNQNISSSNETEGPGGGGGGGLIALTGASGTQEAGGGSGGTTNGPSLTEFTRNGATDGSAGLTGQTAPLVRTAAGSCTNLSISKTNGVSSLVSGGATTYTLTVVNAGPSPADGTTLRDPAASGLSCTSVSCSAVAGGAACPSAGSTTMAYLQGATGITLPTLPAGSTATFTVNCSVTATGN